MKACILVKTEPRTYDGISESILKFAGVESAFVVIIVPFSSETDPKGGGAVSKTSTTWARGVAVALVRGADRGRSAKVGGHSPAESDEPGETVN